LKEVEMTMKQLGFAALVASGLAAAVLGLAVPGQAVTPDAGHHVLELLSEPKGGVDHLNWLDDISPKVTVPQVDTTVQQSR
jgi:hypothetical protein